MSAYSRLGTYSNNYARCNPCSIGMCIPFCVSTSSEIACPIIFCLWIILDNASRPLSCSVGRIYLFHIHLFTNFPMAGKQTVGQCVPSYVLSTHTQTPLKNDNKPYSFPQYTGKHTYTDTQSYTNSICYIYIYIWLCYTTVVFTVKHHFAL